MKKTMNKIILCLICWLLGVGLLIGLLIMGTYFLVDSNSVWHKENIEQIYRDYWNYSLGNYKFAYEVVDDNGGTSGGFVTKYTRDYTFTFRDKNNDLENITVCNGEDLNDEILQNADFILQKDIDKIFQSRSFQEAEGIYVSYNPSFSLDIDRVDKSINLYDLEKGLKFTELSLNKLSENNINITINGISVTLDGEISDYPNLKQKLIDDVKFVFENYEYSNIKFYFKIDPSDDYYNTVYYLTYDGYNYNWIEEYLGKDK